MQSQQIYKKENGIYQRIDELGFDNIENVINIANKKNKKIIFVGNGSIAYKDMIESKMKEALVSVDEKNNILNAGNIGFAAFLKQSEAVDSNNLKPVYLRKSSAEIQNKR